MKKPFHPRALLVAGALLASTMTAGAFDDAQRAEIGEIVRVYILANPEVLIEVQEALEQQIAAEEEQARTALIASSADDLFNNPADPVLGNPDGDVTVVEFFDYNCGFCRRAMADMQEIIETDPNVRFVLKEFPILGPDSIAAHQVALAFNAVAPELYEQFHTELMDLDARASEETALEVAVSLGVDEEVLKRSMADPRHSNSVQNTYQLAEGLGISGTPSYVIGNSLVPGALGVDELRARIAQARTAN
ncbi:MAG: DsbA family protein [Pseudomonadota bacterium]